MGGTVDCWSSKICQVSKQRTSQDWKLFPVFKVYEFYFGECKASFKMTAIKTQITCWISCPTIYHLILMIQLSQNSVSSASWMNCRREHSEQANLSYIRKWISECGKAFTSEPFSKKVCGFLSFQQNLMKMTLFALVFTTLLALVAGQCSYHDRILVS